MKIAGQIFSFPRICALLIFLCAGCAYDLGTTERIELDTLYPESGVKGWALGAANTGLRGDYSQLVDIVPAEAGHADNGVLYVTFDDITISNKNIPYMVIVSGRNVVFDKCRFQPLSCGMGVPIISAQAAGSTFQDCEMDFDSIPLAEVYMSIGVVILNGVIRGCDIHGSSTGVSIHNTSNFMVSIAEGNYVHGLRFQEPAHVDGITTRVSSGRGTIIRNNFVITDVAVATGACFLQAWIGHIDNMLIKGNYLGGVGTNLCLDYNEYGYGDNMRAVDNRLDAWTVQGAGPWYTSYSGGPGWYEWRENYGYDAANPPDYEGVDVANP